MADFYVFAEFNSVWSDFVSAPNVGTSARDATIGDEDSTLQVNATTEFTYTGIPAGPTAYNGPYDMHRFTLSTGGEAVWMAGVGNSGGIVVPLDATAYATFEAGTSFSVSTNSTITSIAYSSFYVPVTNTAPTVSGAPASVSATEDTAGGIDLSGLTFADVDGDTLTVTIAASGGTLAASSGGGVTVSGSGTGTLALSGTASAINTFLDTLSNVQYTGASNVNGTAAATLTVSASDGTAGLASNPSIDVNITAVNDAPTVSGAPASVAATEDTAGGIDLSGLSFADVDGDTLTVTIAASGGTLAASSGGGVTVGGSGTGTLALSGTATAINTFLDTLSNVQYTGASNVNGTAAATLTVSASDGTAGLASNPSIDVNITAVNDDPTGGVSISGTATEDEILTADTSALSDGDGLGSFSYQWLRDGVDIGGATGGSYTLTQDDVGAAISVTVSYTDGEGTAEEVTSSATDAVRYGDRVLIAGDSGEVLRGYYGQDRLIGGGGNDTLIGGVNGDRLRGGAGDDTLRGWWGDDVITGDDGQDLLFGGKGDDILRGNGGDDTLRGRLGNDQLFGGKGSDILIGGKGDDILTGKAGGDTFVFGSASGSDTITDFGRGNDIIEITSGARNLDHLDFVQSGDDVIVSFAGTEITVENTLIAFMQNPDHFLFT